MKYYLIIGYQLFEKNQSFPKIRVNIDNTFLDEFECNNIESKTLSMTRHNDVMDKQEFFAWKRLQSLTDEYTVPKAFKLYEIDTAKWNNQPKHIQLQVTNSYSNYNNGFVSKRSMVLITPVYFMPKELVDEPKKMFKLIERSFSILAQSKWQAHFRSYQWPGIFFSTKEGEGPIHQPKGGEFNLDFKLQRKHKTWLLTGGQEKIIGYPRFSNFLFAWYQHIIKKPFDIKFILPEETKGRNFICEILDKETGDIINIDNEDK